MDKGTKQAVFASLLCLGIVTLVGCAAPAAKDFGGRWRPVNQFQSVPERIQLQRPYVFYASPLDGTLKNMLARWARDKGMLLVYKLPYDYTLYTPVSDIRSPDIADAAAQLNSIYAGEHVAITTVGHEIVVEPASAVRPASSAVVPVANDDAAANPPGKKSSQSAY